MNQAGLLKFINNVFPLLNFCNQANISMILWRLHGIMEILAGSLKNDTVIAIALLYLNHACHYHAFFALSRASSHRFFGNVKVMSPCVYRKL